MQASKQTNNHESASGPVSDLEQGDAVKVITVHSICPTFLFPNQTFFIFFLEGTYVFYMKISGSERRILQSVFTG